MRNDPLKEMDYLFLLLQGELEGWERDFIKSLRRRREWSPKQLALYLKIKKRCFPGAADADGRKNKGETS